MNSYNLNRLHYFGLIAIDQLPESEASIVSISTLNHLREVGLVKFNSWGLSEAGKDLLDQLEEAEISLEFKVSIQL